MKYKIWTYFLLLTLFIGLASCYQEAFIPVIADFETAFVNGDESTPVQLQITNKTEGADTYFWTFEGVPGVFKTVKLDNRPWRNYCKITVSKQDDS